MNTRTTGLPHTASTPPVEQPDTGPSHGSHDTENSPTGGDSSNNGAGNGANNHTGGDDQKTGDIPAQPLTGDNGPTTKVSHEGAFGIPAAAELIPEYALAATLASQAYSTGKDYGVKAAVEADQNGVRSEAFERQAAAEAAAEEAARLHQEATEEATPASEHDEEDEDDEKVVVAGSSAGTQSKNGRHRAFGRTSR